MTRNLNAKKILWSLLAAGLFYMGTVVVGWLGALKTLTEIN